MTAQLGSEDIQDLLPLLLLAKLDASETLDEVKAAEMILRVVDRHCEEACASLEAEVKRLREDISSLALEAKARCAVYPNHPHWEAWNAMASDLNDLLGES